MGLQHKSIFEHIKEAPEDPILSLPIHFAADPRPGKINLGVGTYRTSEGKPWILPSVKKAEQILFEKETSKEYAAIDGEPAYVTQALKLVFGDSLLKKYPEQLFGIQMPGGTPTLSIGANFLHAQGYNKVFISDPTWPNHASIFSWAGIQVEHYPYFDPQIPGIPFDKVCECIKNIPKHSIILLQASAHNPTGFDFSIEQWKILSSLIAEKQLFPYFDLAYQGFAQGIEEDTFPIRYFIEQGHELFVGVSFSKNFSLYGERVGLLGVFLKTPEACRAIRSQFKVIVRPIYSNPPIHGGRIVDTILSDTTLKQEWIDEVKSMRERLKKMRISFVTNLSGALPNKDLDYINHQLGMFLFLGLNAKQVLQLRNEYAIFMPMSGRVNLAGINEKNMDDVVSAFGKILR